MPLIQKGSIKKVVALSTGQADIDFILESGMLIATPYSMSKIALNLAVAKYHVQYASEGILFMAISPGLVDTGMKPDGKPMITYRSLLVLRVYLQYVCLAQSIQRNLWPSCRS